MTGPRLNVGSMLGEHGDWYNDEEDQSYREQFLIGIVVDSTRGIWWWWC